MHLLDPKGYYFLIFKEQYNFQCLYLWQKL